MNLPCSLACFFLKAWFFLRISCGVGVGVTGIPGIMNAGTMGLDPFGDGGSDEAVDWAGVYPCEEAMVGKIKFWALVSFRAYYRVILLGLFRLEHFGLTLCLL